MTDHVEAIATFIRRPKLPIEQTIRLVNLRWPLVSQGELERASRIAMRQLEEDTQALLGMAVLWRTCGASRPG